ncbi:MAG: YrzE family protein [Clostridium sp.]|nr:MAG: YrzE family protein [Clostridium sp.]
MLTLAVIVRFSNVSEKGVVILNTVAKILAIIFGVLVGFKTKSGGLIKGITAGVLYVLLAFLIFALFEKFDGVKFNYFDLLFGVLAGAFFRNNQGERKTKELTILQQKNPAKLRDFCDFSKISIKT